jgi:hypothetical protein
MRRICMSIITMAMDTAMATVTAITTTIATNDDVILRRPAQRALEGWPPAMSGPSPFEGRAKRGHLRVTGRGFAEG